jgi:Ca2+-binding EF-hand superfamily protein
MNQSRIALVNKAFQKLDKTRDGKVTCDDLANVYSVKQHPKYQNGELTEQQILNQFLDTFEVGQHKDGIVMTCLEYLFFYFILLFNGILILGDLR